MANIDPAYNVQGLFLYEQYNDEAICDALKKITQKNIRENYLEKTKKRKYFFEPNVTIKAWEEELDKEE